jgi:RPA family protein
VVDGSHGEALLLCPQAAAVNRVVILGSVLWVERGKLTSL